jgi:hypothetical protein
VRIAPVLYCDKSDEVDGLSFRRAVKNKRAVIRPPRVVKDGLMSDEATGGNLQQFEYIAAIGGPILVRWLRELS